MNSVHITERDILASGDTRKVYTHPEDPALCIKIPKPSLKRRTLRREIRYLRKYATRASSFLTLFHGTVDSNLGKGYIYDLIRDEDGSVSRTLAQCRDLDGLEEKIYDLYLTCLKNKVILSDMNLRNILARRGKGSDYDLWVVDGIGNSDYIKICDLSYYFMKKKMVRKFSRLNRCLGLSLVFD